jgi:hypothetical protein
LHNVLYKGMEGKMWAIYCEGRNFHGSSPRLQ